MLPSSLFDMTPIPQYDFSWFTYQPDRHRDKMLYDLRLRNGEIVGRCYPNGEGWYPINVACKHKRIADYRVTHIRRSYKQ